MTRAWQPTDLATALAALDETPDAVPIAGCTDLLVVDHAQRRHHPAVIDVTRIPELQGIAAEPDWLSIGAATTFSTIRSSKTIQDGFPILAEVAAVIGGWQIQNRATLGGNIANASPAGDSLPVLLALGAELELASATGTRRLDYAGMHTGYKQTALTPGELITRVCLRWWHHRDQCVQKFTKVGTRQAQAISKVAVALATRLSAGTMQDLRIGAASVAAYPIRLSHAEAAGEGAPADMNTASAVAAAARAEVQPIDDVRSTAEYRAFALERVLRRMVSKLIPES